MLELLRNLMLFLYLEAPGFLLNFFINVPTESIKQTHSSHKCSIYRSNQDTETAYRDLFYASFILYAFTALKHSDDVYYWSSWIAFINDRGMRHRSRLLCWHTDMNPSAKYTSQEIVVVQLGDKWGSNISITSGFNC